MKLPMSSTARKSTRRFIAMTTPLSRRDFVLTGALALLPAPARVTGRRTTAPDRDTALAEIERRVGGRLGVAALDTASGWRMAWRADERFAMCSTFKILLTGLVLSRVDTRRERLERVIPYSAADVLSWAPVTRAHARDGGMSVSALCAAALEYSDNTAANLLLGTVGGPAAVTSWARALGDPVTRLDRIEPALNSAQPGDPRDTSTPAAMLEDTRRLVVDDVLSSTSRDLLRGWLGACTTGGARLRAGLPPSWWIGDKTGTGDHGATNDVAIGWPANGRGPVLVVAYLTETTAPSSARDAALASVARAVIASLKAD